MRDINNILFINIKCLRAIKPQIMHTLFWFQCTAIVYQMALTSNCKRWWCCCIWQDAFWFISMNATQDDYKYQNATGDGPKIKSMKYIPFCHRMLQHLLYFAIFSQYLIANIEAPNHSNICQEILYQHEKLWRNARQA